MRPHQRRQRAYRFGLLAECACILLLWLKGYRLVARRYRNGMGEVDIIAARTGTLAFIEVKARKDAGQGMEALTAMQRQRVVNAASLYLATAEKYAGHAPRFDFMVVAPWAWPTHIENAWDAGNNW